MDNICDVQYKIDFANSCQIKQGLGAFQLNLFIEDLLPTPK